MSIISTLRTYLSEYGRLSFILTDVVKKDPSSYALAAAGGGSVHRDILGNVTYQNSYVFYAKESASDEVDRQDNHDELEGFCEWLQERNETGDLPVLPDPIKAVSLDVSNLMLVEIDEGGSGVYQLQIQFIFERRNNT